MKKFIVILLSVMLVACGNVGSSNIDGIHDVDTSQVVAVAELPSKLGLTPMSKQPLMGGFEFFFSDLESGIFKSVFVSQRDDEVPLMRYLSYTSMSLTDTLQIGENEIVLPVTHKMNPNSIKAYRLKHKDAAWLLLAGRGPSASGRGARKMFYVLISSPDNELYSLLSSALGDVQSFGYCDQSGEVFFIELTNSTKKVDSYNLVIKEIDGKSVGEKLETELEYNMRDSLIYSGELQTLCSAPRVIKNKPIGF